MKAKKRFLASYSVFDIIIIAMCAGLGIAIKPVIVPLSHIITGPLFIPGGTVAGGFYMLFIVLAAGLTHKLGAATLACVVQALLVLVSGTIGSHGVFSLLTYTFPGIAVDLLYLAFGRKGLSVLTFFLMGAVANLVGTFGSNLVFFRLPFEFLMLALFAGTLSGGLGGIIAWTLSKQLNKLAPVFGKKNKEVNRNEK